MRLTLIVSLMASLSSFANWTLEINSGDYRLDATLIQDHEMSITGPVVAKTLSNGQCDGQFAFDFDTYLITISFDSPGCQNESVSIQFTNENFGQMLTGQEVPVKFKSQIFNNEEKDGLAKALDI